MTRSELQRQMDALYERHGQPLEAEHRGKYVAIAPDGQTVLAPTLQEAMDEAAERLGPGVFLFKVGEKAVYRWR